MPDICPTSEEVLDSLNESNANNDDTNFAKKITDFVFDLGIFGATNSQILSLIPNPYKGNLSVIELLDILINTKIIIRTGIEKTRYVHFEHKKLWTVNSYKILRLDREKLPVVTSSTKEKLSCKLYRKKANYHVKEVEISRERLDLNSQQLVKVIMSPWIRIDGTLNRRVLDRWIGTILITCLQQPGISLQNLMHTFTFLRPVELENIIRYLVRLKCVRQFVVKKSKTTLFSSIPTTTIEPATGLEDPKDVFIDPFSDATTKYAVFVGKKTYVADFLST